MLLLIIRRLQQALLALWLMSLLVFLGVYALGNPLDLLIDPQATPEEIALTAHRLGLDQSWWTQYLHFMWGLCHGDLGVSFAHGIPAIQLILQRLPATLELAIVAMGIALLLGIPLGMLAGAYPQRCWSRLLMTGSVIGFSLPTFWVGLVLILIFAVQNPWLPASGRGQTRLLFGIEWSVLTRDGWAHLILPACNLALFKLSLVIRLIATGTREVLAQDFIRFARAKGLSNQTILMRYVLRNTLTPMITVMGMEFASLLAFAVVTESVFAWPGMGKLLLDAILTLNRPVVISYLLLVAVLFIFINLVVDLLYFLLDPRLRY